MGDKNKEVQVFGKYSGHSPKDLLITKQKPQLVSLSVNDGKVRDF